MSEVLKPIVYPIDCPVCGRKNAFRDEFDVCEECEWIFDAFQYRRPDEDMCANDMSLNQAKEAWKKGEKVH